jgi:hypothetical protein
MLPLTFERGKYLNLVGKTEIVEFYNVLNGFDHKIRPLVNSIEFVANVMGVGGGEE